MAIEEVKAWFGEEFGDRERRLSSYDQMENFILASHTDWNIAPSTDKIVRKFEAEIASVSDQELAFLLVHSGYIPETYGADSSQETLYSKLIEALVKTWAMRIGFDQSVLPTQKSSKEDITIADAEGVIVCDAKSYRLGRSQKAPNVKDALKQGDIKKWLSAYPPERRIGGLVTFPSQHDWNSGSDFYAYLTDYTSPVMMLFYEHLAFLLLARISKSKITSFLRGHQSHFPAAHTAKSSNRALYFAVLDRAIINTSDLNWADFSVGADFIVREKASHTKDTLEKFLIADKKAIADHILESQLTVEELVKELSDARFMQKHHNLVRQVVNIKSFRKL